MHSSSDRPPSALHSALVLWELTYHSIVRTLRKEHGNAVIGLALNVMQTVIFVGAFYFMFTVLGMKSSAIRGDFLLYIMSGIFLYMTHTKAMSAVASSEGPASPMMKHAPMNTVISISAAALTSLYIQVLSMAVVLGFYHIAMNPITIDDPIGAMAMVLLAWFSGVAVGMVLLAIRPWFPGFVKLMTTIYSRANMIASGKMFVANQLPGYMLAMFTWNPIFHIIDQSRGFVFINYNPHYSNTTYPLVVSLILIFIGLLGEFYTRRNASLSWQAKR
ncbi:ABC transporter permease [Tropicimonas sp. IMCC34011]|uniref:ABC transporter permease n=1 Tax=Tropicimonas sp. IMCC34011 TaxID=2248759 RepID=UPI000E270060|nr:ABC transporter permease [Tropicimonas sp. IMCC34011]